MLFYEHDPVVRHDMGGFRKVWVLAEELRREGHRVVVFAPRGSRPRGEIAVEVVDVPVLNAPVIRPLLVYALLFLLPLVHAWRHRPDCVYTRPQHSPLPVLLARLLRVPLVLEVNGDSHDHYRTLGASRWRLGFVDAVDGFLARGADLIVPITDGLARMLEVRYGVPADRMRVIGSGSDPELFRPLDALTCRQKLGLDVHASFVGFVGSFFRYQGIDTLIDAAPRILRAHPRARFLLVGDGVTRAEWAGRVETAGLGDAFVFTGQVPYADVATYIGAMSVCVAPFLANRGETSPLKIFDYLACGRPVVASRIPAVEPIVAACGAVVAVPPDDPDALADAIVGLLADPGQSAQLGARGRDFIVKRHSWRQAAVEMAQTLESVRRH